MEVLALIPNQYGHAPGQRSSIELWESVLAPVGINIHYAPFETERLHEVLYRPGHYATKVGEMVRAYIERIRLLGDLKRFDAVFVYREAALLGPAFLEKMVARRGLPIIYQLDDPLFIPYMSPSNGYLSYLKFFGKISEICRLSKVVMVNSTQIREYVSQYNQNIWQVPSVVDTSQYVFRPDLLEADPEEVCIGWSGSPSARCSTYDASSGVEIGPPWHRTTTSSRTERAAADNALTRSTQSSSDSAVSAPIAPPVVRPMWHTTMSAPAPVMATASCSANT